MDILRQVFPGRLILPVGNLGWLVSSSDLTIPDLFFRFFERIVEDDDDRIYKFPYVEATKVEVKVH